MASRQITALAGRAQFIFSGTIERTGAATFAAVPVDDATAVVRVERVFRAPAVLGDQTERSITIQLLKPDAKEGTRAVFFATGWLYGESIAVTEVGRTTDDDLDKVEDQLQGQRDERELLDRLAKADLVVVGKIGRIAPAPKDKRLADSEHDPQWFVAEVKVDSVEKGRQATGKPARLAFPSSDDVQWFWRPKPQAGQDGIWLLHKEQLAGVPAGALTALHPQDFQPRHNLDYVRLLLSRVR